MLPNDEDAHVIAWEEHENATFARARALAKQRKRSRKDYLVGNSKARIAKYKGTHIESVRAQGVRYQVARESERAAAGLCIKGCGRPLRTKVRCRECAAAHAARSRTVRAAKKAASS